MTDRYFEEPTSPRLVFMGFVVGFMIICALSGQYFACELAVAVAVKHLRSPLSTGTESGCSGR